MPALRFLALAVADAATLVADRLDFGQLARDLAAPSEWVHRVGADSAAGTLAAAALWCVAVWVALGLLAALAGALPGAVGRAADRLARLVLPAAVYRLTAGAIGLGVVLAPAAAGATPPPATPPTPSSAAPAWPSDAPLPAPAWPATASVPTRPVRDDPPAPAVSAPPTVVVRPGDSLWSIAAAQLPPGAPLAKIARAWPRWYGANRAVIGDDPDLIRPGEVLHIPSHSPSHEEDRT